MNTYTISQKSKNKHLKFHHYEYIINDVNSKINLKKKWNVKFIKSGILS